MNISELYPSKYIKADDLQGQQAPVTVMSITVEEIADKEFKPVMRFMGKEKGMVLNKTNAINCASVWGDDTIAWQGQHATLLAAPVMFQGKQVMGLQLLPKPPQQQAQQPGAFNQPQRSNDEITQAQFQQPGPHDHQVAVQRPTAPGRVVGSTVESLEKDIAAAEQHAVDPAGNLDDLPF